MRVTPPLGRPPGGGGSASASTNSPIALTEPLGKADAVMALRSGQYQRLPATSLLGVNMVGMGVKRTTPRTSALPSTCPAARVAGALLASGTAPRFTHTT